MTNETDEKNDLRATEAIASIIGAMTDLMTQIRDLRKERDFLRSYLLELSAKCDEYRTALETEKAKGGAK